MSAVNPKYVLAIDLGTTGAKVGLVSTAGEIVGYEFEETPVLLLPDGGAEQRPDDWWNAITKAARRLLEKRAAVVADVVALSCTSQWSGTVAVDRNGSPLMNAIIWMDSRGAPFVQRITDGLLKVEGFALFKLLRWLRVTGGIPGHAGRDPIAHILYIKHELPEIYEQTYKFLEPKDYLNLRFTGRYAASYDSITLHWLTDNRDIHNIAYDDRLIGLSGVDRDKLPDLKQAVDILGPIRPEIVAELGLTETVPVVMGTPDIPSAALGSGAVRDYEGHLYIGTSTWLVSHVPFKKTDVRHNIASLPAAIPGKYLATNEQGTSGACLAFLRDILFSREDAFLGEAEKAESSSKDVYRAFDQIAARVPAGSGKLIFTPWLYGERTPVDDHTIRGGFHNLSLQTTRKQMIRAVFEGVAYNARWLLGYMENFLKRRFNAIHMIGGGADSDIWCQIHADVFDRTIRQVQEPILANLRGAAFLASAALGYLTFDDIPARVKISNTYVPNPQNREIYDELFAEFVDIYKRDKGMYARLNRGT